MNRKVLLVEDHDDLRQLIRVFLSKQFDVTGVKNGLEALSHLGRGFVPDVIVTDARMPELNGLQFISQLRYSGLFAHIPVVVISGSAEGEGEESRFRQLGARDYFRKPFNPIQLQERLIQITASSQQIF